MRPTPHVCILLLSALCLWGCGDKTSSVGDEPPVRVPIGFISDITTEQDTQTRGEVITDISNMYVFASYTATNDWTAAAVPNFMYRQLMEKTAGSWTYSPLKYWPDNADDRISFFACAPITLDGVAFSALGVAGPEITYTVPTGEVGKQDLLVSSALNRKKGSGTVAFTMQHALTQVKFKVKKSAAMTVTAVTLTGLSVLAPGGGKLSFKADADNSRTWSCGTPVTFTAALNGETAGRDIDDTGADVASFFLIPVAADNKAASPTLKLTYTLVTASGPNTGTVSMNSTLELDKTKWTSGSSVVYTITIIDDRAEVSSVTVTDFDANGTQAGGDIPAT